MVFGIKNKFMLKLIIFIISVIIMIGSYSFVSALY
ncbi:putative membrane protein, partial [Yersinia pestis PY-66]